MAYCLVMRAEVLLPYACLSPLSFPLFCCQVHEALEFDASNHDRFGIWSVRWSKTGNEIIAGACTCDMTRPNVIGHETTTRHKTDETYSSAMYVAISTFFQASF